MTRTSVVVCTHARSGALRACLDHVLDQLVGAPEPDKLELLVIDNASPDDTSQVAASALSDVPLSARVISEPTLGLSHARNRGIREAQGDVVVFLDDDAYPRPGWLGGLLGAFSDPFVEASGGPVNPRFDGPLPAWLDHRYLPYLSAWDRGPTAHDLVYNEYPRGANIAFRRSALERVGPFSPRLGRRGTRLASCEEIEICLRIERTGGRVRYQPDARVDHVVPTARLDAHWMARRFHWQGRSEAVLEWIHGGWPALRVGMARNARHLRDAQASGDLLRAAFYRATRIGYLLGVLEAPWAQRFRGAGAAQWLPFP